MRSQSIRLVLVLLISLSACTPAPVSETPTRSVAASATSVPTIAPSETPKPSDTPAPTDTPAPSIQITKPEDNGQLGCDNSAQEAFCLFHVQGKISGISSFSDYRVYVFVYPISPAGAGWYLQKSPAAIDSDGSWEQSPSYLGNTTYPATNGDTLKIRVVLVKDDATWNDTELADLVKLKEEIILVAVEDIDGDVAISDTVHLTLNK